MRAPVDGSRWSRPGGVASSTGNLRAKGCAIEDPTQTAYGPGAAGLRDHSLLSVNEASLCQSQSGSSGSTLETDLYRPIKTYLEGLGLKVKGEVCGCDLVALPIPHPSSL
jgi:hypothetical protein